MTDNQIMIFNIIYFYNASWDTLQLLIFHDFVKQH